MRVHIQKVSKPKTTSGLVSLLGRIQTLSIRVKVNCLLATWMNFSNGDHSEGYFKFFHKKNSAKGVQSHLNFRKFKVALNPLCRFFLNFAKSCVLSNLVPRSLEDEAEGEIWPNTICITWSPVRNVTGEASAHAQHIRSSQGRFCRVQQAYDRSTTWLTNIRSNLWISLLSWNQTSAKWGRKVFSTTWPDLFLNTFATVGEF